MTKEQQEIVDMVALDVATYSDEQRVAAMALHLDCYAECVRRHWPNATREEVVRNTAAFALAVNDRLAQMDLSAGIVGSA
jgi:hypothetical protein